MEFFRSRNNDNSGSINVNVGGNFLFTSSKTILKFKTKQLQVRRMASSGMLSRVATRTTRRNIPEDAIVRSHRRENLKSYTITGKAIRFHH
jgi:hypothetical protein